MAEYLHADGSPAQDGDVYVIRNGVTVAEPLCPACDTDCWQCGKTVQEQVRQPYTAQQIKKLLHEFDTAAGLERLETAKKMASMLAGFARSQDPAISLQMARS